MSITLGIDDEDAADIVRDLECSFDIVISDPEAAACRTLGDVYDLLLQRFEGRDGGELCSSAMAFYRLRRACAPLSPEMKLRPATRLRDITGASVKQFFKAIENATGLRLPHRTASWVGTVGAISLLAGLLGVMAVGALCSTGLVSWKWVLAPVAMITAAPFLFSVDPGEFPENCQTSGTFPAGSPH